MRAALPGSLKIGSWLTGKRGSLKASGPLKARLFWIFILCQDTDTPSTPASVLTRVSGWVDAWAPTRVLGLRLY